MRTFRATEHIAYGFVDSRGFVTDWKWDERVQRLFSVMRTVFRTDAQARGYCMALWDSHVPKGFGHAGNGVLR